MRSILVAAVLVIAAPSPAQRIIATTSAHVVTCNRELDDLEPYGAPPASTHVATDGFNAAWVTHGDTWALGRIDLVQGGIVTRDTTYAPRGVAMTPDGGVVVVENDGLGQGWLERFDAAGSSLWLRPTDSAAQLVAVDRIGQIWVTHGVFVTSLTRHAPDGTLLSRSPLDPLPERIAPSPLGYVWTLCTLTGQVYCYGESGDLALQFGVASGTSELAVDGAGNLALLDTATDTLELRDGTGGNVVSMPLSGDPGRFAFDAGGGIWTASPTNGLVSFQKPPGAPPISATVGLGLSMVGDWSGLGFLTCAGRAADTDGDGVANGLELEAGHDPLDPQDVPMGIDLLAPATPGATVPFRVRSAVTTPGLYWLCAAASPAAMGEGPWGLPLAQDWLFDAFQASWPALVFAIAAAFDGSGEDLNALFVPAGAAGATFWMAFVALRTSDLLIVPSPVVRIDVS